MVIRARASDFSGSGAWSELFYYHVEIPLDTDDDGIPDEWEALNGTNPALADANGDGDFLSAQLFRGMQQRSFVDWKRFGFMEGTKVACFQRQDLKARHSMVQCPPFLRRKPSV